MADATSTFDPVQLDGQGMSPRQLRKVLKALQVNPPQAPPAVDVKIPLGNFLTKAISSFIMHSMAHRYLLVDRQLVCWTAAVLIFVLLQSSASYKDAKICWSTCLWA